MRAIAETYDDLQNADMIRVIDRRKGMPIALSILYSCRTLEWVECGRVEFSGAFFVQGRTWRRAPDLDPFDQCAVMEAPDLRNLIKKIRGANAELSADYYAPCSNRDTLIRLQNNVKLRLIDAEEYAPALECVEMMRCLDPHEYRLLFDAGVLYAKTGQGAKAVSVLEEYIRRAPNARDRRDAEAIIRQIGELPDQMS